MLYIEEKEMMGADKMDEHKATSSAMEYAIMDYKKGNSRMQELLPDVASSYFKFTDACFEEGALCKKQKQLTALGISIHAQDEYCILYHAKGAAEAGATETEIMETIAVSAALGGGAAFAQGLTLAMDAYQHFQGGQQ